MKNVFLEISQNSQENTRAGGAWNFIKKDILPQLFSCEFCEISKNNFFHRKPLVAAFAFLRLTEVRTYQIKLK